MFDETQNEVSPPLDIMELAYADSFKQFDAELSVIFDEEASKTLGKDYWRVTKAFRYYLEPVSENGDSRRWVYVPEGFLTDGASIPKPFWFLLKPWGNYGQAAVVHDILCETSTIYSSTLQPIKINRAMGDNIFREAMKVAGVSTFIRQLLFVAVRCWSRWGWDTDPEKLQHKRQLEAEYRAN